MFCTQCGTQYEGENCPACNAASQIPSTPTTPNYGASTNAPFSQSSELKLSGWWKRVGATVVDTLVILPVIIVVGVVLGIANTPTIATNIASFVVEFVYMSLMWTRQNGQTVGAKALGIRVVNLDGSPMTNEIAYRRAAVLMLFNVASGITWVLRGLGSVLLLLNVLWPLWDPKKQTLHDKAAGTIVIEA